MERFRLERALHPVPQNMDQMLSNPRTLTHSMDPLRMFAGDDKDENILNASSQDDQQPDDPDFVSSMIDSMMHTLTRVLPKRGKSDRKKDREPRERAEGALQAQIEGSI